jgi:hypothetical protein
MTPNGAVLFGLAVAGAAMASGSIAGLGSLAVVCLAFGAIEIGRRAWKALAWSLGIVAPLALFMAAVWVGVVGRSPAEIAAGETGTRGAALAYVLLICARLFMVALAIQLAVLRFAHLTPLQFIRALRIPLLVKKLLVLTLAWIDTILQAADRSRTALIAAGIIAPRLSLKNAANGWILVQTAWLSAITIAIGRLRDKWPAETTLARLDEALHAPAKPLAAKDWLWLLLVAAAVMLPKAL